MATPLLVFVKQKKKNCFSCCFLWMGGYEDVLFTYYFLRKGIHLLDLCTVASFCSVCDSHDE